MQMPPIILASASPRRAKLLRQLEIDFQVLPGHADEAEHEFLTPTELAQLNAHRKARVIAKQHPDALVIGADTVVCLDTMVFGKPSNLSMAHRMLALLQGKIHHVITGVCLMRLRSHQERMFAVNTRVEFRPLIPAQIDDYLKKINPLDKAGAYAIQDHGEMIVKRITGSFSNVVGLPLERLRRELPRFAI